MHELGDFTTGRRVTVITAIAIGIGFVCRLLPDGTRQTGLIVQVGQRAFDGHRHFPKQLTSLRQASRVASTLQTSVRYFVVFPEDCAAAP